MKKALLHFGFLSMLSIISISAFAQEGKDALYREAIERHEFTNTYSNAKWEPIEESNIAWKKRVWRTIDLSAAGNQFLDLAPTHVSIGDMLLNGVYNSSFKPHNAYKEDRFITELTVEQIQELKATNGNDVTALRIKEDWIYLKNEKKMVVHIIAMAPVIKKGDGTEEALFWLYYPDTREYLQKQQIAAKGIHPETMDEVFEGRFFSSKVEKLSGER